MEILPIALPDAELLYVRNFIPASEQQSYFEALRNQTPWRSDSITLFGKKVLQPRLVAWFGPQPYTYSGLTLPAQPLSPLMDKIKSQIEALTGYRFNCLLANYYRNGRDSMGWHSDDEAMLGKNPVIASVSFGATRRFKFRHRRDHSRQIDLWLESGSLLLMAGATQHHYHHALPKTARPIGERINLTYRFIVE